VAGTRTPVPISRVRPAGRPRGLPGLILAALVPLVLFGGYAALEAQRAYVSLNEARLSGTAKALSGAVEAQLNAAVTALVVFASARSLDPPVNPPAFMRRGAEVGAALGGKLALYDAAAGHPLLASTGMVEDVPRTAAMDAALAKAFGEGRPVLSDLLLPDPSIAAPPGGAGFVILVPVRRGGAMVSALALRLNQDGLRRLLAAQDLPVGSFAAIADGRFRIAASTLDPAGQQGDKTAPAWVASAMAGRQRGLIVGAGLDSPSVAFAFERLALAPGWTVVVAQPVADQRAAAWEAAGWMAGGAGAIAAGLVVLVWGNRRTALREARREAAALEVGRAQVERLHAGLPAIIFLRAVAADDSSLRTYQGGDIETVTGWPAATITGAPDMFGWSEPDRLTMPQMIGQTRETGSKSFDWRMRRPDGTWHWMRSSLRFLETNPDGSGLVVGYILNVTAEREAAARASVAGRMASLGEMATGLAHELKQPLAIASMAAQNAKRALGRGDATGVERRLDTIATQMERGGTIIDHLRRFATVGDPGARPEAVSLAAVVDGAMTLVGSMLRDAGVEVDVALDPPGLRVLGHRVPLEQVMLNLLTNARDAIASLPPEAPRRIRLEAVRDGDRVRLTVADTGGGIPAALLDRVFEPFLTTKGPDRGTGLGLSICFGRVAAMGGSITAANGAAGAVFTLDLPAVPEDGAAPGDAGRPSLATAP